jgi:hypothetical protein
MEKETLTILQKNWKKIMRKTCRNGKEYTGIIDDDNIFHRISSGTATYIKPHLKDGIVNWHSHVPLNLIKSKNVSFSPPSIPDIYTALIEVLACRCKHSVVFTKEGIYEIKTGNYANALLKDLYNSEYD